MGSGRKIRGGADFLSHTVETTPPLSVDGDIVEFDGASGTKIKDGGLTHADVADAISKKHAQNADQYLDYGGANQVSAADLHTTVDAQVDLEAKKHSQNTDQYIDYGGANQKSAAQIKAAHDHISNVSNPHSVTAAQVAAIATANGTLNALSEKTSVLDDDVLILEDSAASYAQKKIKKSNLVTAVASSYNQYRLTSYYQPSLSDGMYGAFKAGWQPYWFNQQWGGAPVWMDNLVDGATGEAYTFQAATGSAEAPNGSFSFGYDNTYMYSAQSFKVSKTQTISAIWVRLYKVGNPTGNVKIQIRTDNSGSPSVTMVTNGETNSIAGTLMTSSGIPGGWYRFVFSTPPTLTANTVYHLLFYRSDANSSTNFFANVTNTARQYPHGYLNRGTNVPAWSATTTTAMCFLIEPVTNMLATSGQFDGKLTFSEGSPLNQSEAITQPLKNFFDHLEGTITVVGASWTKDKTIWDAQYGLDHDRIVLRCNVTTGYAQVDLYDKTGTKYTVTGTTDISTSTVRRITVAYRSKNDGSDFLKLYVHATSEGTPITGASINFDPLMKELGNMTLGGGYALAPTWTWDTTMNSIPSADGYTYGGTATEAAHAVVSGGKLFIQIVGSTDTCSWYRDPTFSNANGLTAAYKLRIPKGYNALLYHNSWIGLYDGTKRVDILHQEYWDEVSYDGMTTSKTVQSDNKVSESPFLVSVKGSDLFLFKCGKVVMDGTGLVTNATATNRFYFGEGTASAGANSESTWDYVKGYTTSNLPPQFTSGSLSEFAYFSGDQTGLLAALYNSGTLKSVKELCGVGRNFIDVGERILSQVGLTANPTTASITGALCPEMELFVYGSDIETDFTLTAAAGTGGSPVIVFTALDGKQSDGQTSSCSDASYYETVATKSVFKTSFGLKKLEGRWLSSGATLTAYGAWYRRFNVKSK